MWREIPSFPGYYANEHGQIHGKKGGNLLLQYLNHHGYPEVRVHYRGVPHTRRVHKLVAEAFHGPKPDGHEINHKNMDRTDNRPYNLEYVSRSENMKHAYEHGLVNPPGNPKINDVDADVIRWKYEIGYSQGFIAQEYSLTQANVSSICTGKTWIKEKKPC